MNHLSNIDAIYKEFPFLEKHTKRSSVEKANVKRWNTDSINDYYPQEYTFPRDREYSLYSSKYSRIYTHKAPIIITRRLQLLDSQGSLVYVVGKKGRENIGQALHSIRSQRGEICYGLERFYFKKFFWRVIPEVLTIFKLPKGITNCENWMESIVNVSLQEIKNL